MAWHVVAVECKFVAYVRMEVPDGAEPKENASEEDWWIYSQGTLPAIARKKLESVTNADPYRDPMADPRLVWSNELVYEWDIHGVLPAFDFEPDVDMALPIIDDLGGKP